MPERKAKAKAAVHATAIKVEKMLGSSHAYRKVEDGLYAIKQGTSMVMIKVHPWKDHALIRLVAQLVKGVSMECGLAMELLQLNAILRFGSFAYVTEGRAIVLCHTLLDRDLGDKAEFIQTIQDFAFVADEYDDRIQARFGGQTMEDLMEESVIERMRESGGPEPG
jgi:hypothetical protein